MRFFRTTASEVETTIRMQAGMAVFITIEPATTEKLAEPTSAGEVAASTGVGPARPSIKKTRIQLLLNPY